MDDVNSRVITDSAPAFPSFIALRAKHSELLQREPDTEGAQEQCLKEVEQFIKQVQATGAILSADEERRTSQNILNYWVSTLYRQDQVARLVTLADYDRSWIAEVGEVFCPYPGVRAFTEEDNQFFFGRQRQIDYMVGRLKEDRLLVIVGASGSGKTSLVQAGLLPALKKKHSNDLEHFFFPPIVPGSDPLMSLALMIKKARNSAEDDPKWLHQQVEGFQKDKEHLLKLIEELTDRPAVIFIDQGEELYERTVNRWLRPLENILDLDNSKSTIEPILDNLVSVVQAQEKKHIVIVARRLGDYEPKFNRLPTRVKEVFEPAKVILPALYASELSDAIQKPAELLGVKFEEAAPQTPNMPLASDLRPKETTVQALIREISSEAVGLPLLQFVLPRLWEKRDGNRIPDAAVRGMGSCRSALTNTAEEFYTSLSSPDQRACRRLLTKLVTIDSDLKAHVYPVRRATLYSIEKDSRVDSLLEELTKQELIRVSKGEMPADDWVELTHESLLSNWSMLSSWIESKRFRRRRSQALKVVGLAAIIAAVMFAAFLVVGWQQQRTKSRDLARLSSKQLANNRFDLALLLGVAAHQTEVNTATRSNLHKLLFNLQFTPQPERFLRKDNFEPIDVAFTIEPEGPPSRLAAINIEGKIVIWDLNWENPPAVEQTLTEKSKATLPISFSPDGKKLATASTDPRVEGILWNLADGKYEELSLNAPTDTSTSEDESEFAFPTSGLVFTPDGKALISAGAKRRVIRWDIERDGVKGTTLFTNKAQINSVAVNPQGQMAMGDDDGAILLLDVSGKRAKPRVVSQGHTTETVGDAIYSVAFNSDGHLLAASRIDRAMIWDVESGESQREFRTGLPPAALLISFNDPGRTLLGYDAEGNIFSWNVQPGSPLGTRLQKAGSASLSASFSKNGKFLALPNEDGAIVWDISSERALEASGRTNSIAFKPGDNTLAVGGDEGLTTWQARNPDQHQILAQSSEEGEVFNLAYSADGAILATGLSNGVISLREANSLNSTLTLTRTFEVPKDTPDQVPSATIAEIVFDPRRDGHWLVEALNIDAAETPKAFSEIILWNADTGEKKSTLAVSKGKVTALAFRPDGKFLVWSTTDPQNGSKVSRWDFVEQKRIDYSIQAPAQVTSLTFSPDGKVLAIGLDNGKIALWDESYKETTLLEGISGEVGDLEFNPDGSILACAINRQSALEGKQTPGTIILWDMLGGKGEHPEQLGDLLKGHRNAITSIAFSPDGKILVSGGVDKEVFLWDVNVAGARNRFCAIIDCRGSYEEMAQQLDKENLFQWLYRITMRKSSLRELNQ